MDTTIIAGLLVLAALFVQYVWNGVVTDTTINLAQGAVDASRCCMLFDQIEAEQVDIAVINESEEFDLPFIDLTVGPSFWWYEVWLWDFKARTLVMTHFAQKSTLIGVDASDFYE